MNLKQLLIENDLLKYIEGYCSDNLNRMTFNSYEKIENGFILHTKGKDYKVTVKVYDGYTTNKDKVEYTYLAEERINKNGYVDCFFKIPCRTRAEEHRYPKVAGWLGTALVEKQNSL